MVKKALARLQPDEGREAYTSPLHYKHKESIA